MHLLRWSCRHKAPEPRKSDVLYWFHEMIATICTFQCSDDIDLASRAAWAESCSGSEHLAERQRPHAGIAQAVALLGLSRGHPLCSGSPRQQRQLITHHRVYGALRRRQARAQDLYAEFPARVSSWRVTRRSAVCCSGRSHNSVQHGGTTRQRPARYSCRLSAQPGSEAAAGKRASLSQWLLRTCCSGRAGH